ncbi:cholinesterase 1-like isoform X2 [Cimex lectularius]|uniref:Carboxylic ester hydrolase n=1 Tax=Cimex lectularius TaxID=79782 RepID=A0A8I6S546_CIMLE|nr:cholinesterase 1-like isoform X2 [Cimex lectularius]
MVKIVTESRIKIYAFLGVPYAAPPLGPLRFASPEKHGGWSENEPFSADNFGPACVQPLHELVPNFGVKPMQDEDCLTLNVWTSEAALTYKNAPVVIFFEGEGFVTGYSGRFPGEDLAAEGIVIVSANYRLNVFGFFCLENTEARGNVGLLDQYLALVWVRENIEQFGGDPRSITLMGHSAGATSIAYHLISPRTQGLFHKAILMSGNVFSPWSKSNNPSNASKEIAKSLGCFSKKVHSMLNCLQSKSAEEILKAYEMLYMGGNWTELPLPVIDSFLPETEQYLPMAPDEAYAKGNFLKIPVMSGITMNDGIVAISQWTDLFKQDFFQLKHLFLSSIIPSVIQKYNLSDLNNFQQLQTILQWYYLDLVKDGDTTSLISKLIDFFTDSQFTAPHRKQLSFLSNTTINPLSTVYAYQFEQEENHLYHHLNISGSGHGEELLFLFGPPLLKKVGRIRLTSSEERLSTVMRRFWVEFIRKGSLSLSPYGYGIPWRRYVWNEDNYVIFRSDNSLPLTQTVMRLPSMSLAKDAMSKYTIRLWNDLLPDLHDLHNQQNSIIQSQRARDTQLTKDLPYRSAMYTLICFVIVLLVLLIVCVVLLKKHVTERERDMF